MCQCVCMSRKDTEQERSSSGCSMIPSPLPLSSWAGECACWGLVMVMGGVGVSEKYKLWKGHFLLSCLLPIVANIHMHDVICWGQYTEEDGIEREGTKARESNRGRESLEGWVEEAGSNVNSSSPWNAGSGSVAQRKVAGSGWIRNIISSTFNICYLAEAASRQKEGFGQVGAERYFKWNFYRIFVALVVYEGCKMKDLQSLAFWKGWVYILNLITLQSDHTVDVRGLPCLKDDPDWERHFRTGSRCICSTKSFK